MSPNCECGHERGDHGPKMWGCAHCPCTEYEARTPAPSPTLKHRYVDRPPLVIDEGDTPSASPEADKRMWLVSRDVESGELGVINLVAQASRDRTDQEWQRMCQYSTDHVRVVPQSELARVQRERDEAMAWRKDHLTVVAAHVQENATLRAQLAAVEKFASETLDRARVAEQRIETAKKSLCGLLDPSKTMFCTKDSLVNEVERIVSTLGRFVADQEGA